MPSKRRITRESKDAKRGVRWKLIVAPLLILALGGVAVTLLIDPFNQEDATEPAADPAPVAFSPSSVDFGEMPSGSTESATVQLRNVGTVPLRILGVRSSCVCLTADMPVMTLAPGASAPLSLTMDALFTPGLRHYTATVLVAGHDPAVLHVQRTTVTE